MSPGADSVTMEVRGLDALIRRLDKAPVRKFANEALEKSTKAVHKRLSGYTQTFPRRRPQQKYIRTFMLKGSIKFIIRPFGASSSGEGRVYTGLDYAPYVLGHASQTRIFADRWWTEKSVAEEMAPVVGKHFSEALDKAAKAIAGGVI